MKLKAKIQRLAKLQDEAARLSHEIRTEGKQLFPGQTMLPRLEQVLNRVSVS